MYKLILPDNVVSGLRISSLAALVIFTIHINIKTVIAAIAVLGKLNAHDLLIFRCLRLT